MKTIYALITTIILTTLLAITSKAADYKVGPMEITHVWAKATPKGAKVAGGYLKISNTGKETDRLTGGSFTGARKLEVHEMSVKDGIMSMKALNKGLEIKPGTSVELKPGSFHLMIFGLTKQLKHGNTVKGTLTFEKAGEVDVEFKIIGSVAPLNKSNAQPHRGSRHH